MSSQASVCHSVPNRRHGCLLAVHPYYELVGTHSTGMLSCYRPQRSYEGYVYSGVCLSTGGGGWWYPSMHRRWYPNMPCNRSPGGGSAPRGGLLPGGLLLGGSAPRGGCLLRVGVCVETPLRKQTATVADGTHPTGMLSCFKCTYLSWTSVFAAVVPGQVTHG